MPQTDRLYYSQPTIRWFEARVVRSEARGDQTAVWLDRTAFYPTSGGQPHDLGTLGGAPVHEVQEDEAGGVVHLVGAPAPAAGVTVHGDIDWGRRVDHMQQHTGQHLLSAVLEHLFHARTVSFHLGTESSTIDLDRELTPAQLARGEDEANQAIWRNVPVLIRYATEDEARAMPLRKESARTGTLRLIEIEGIDLSACGGTHVASTGALGQLVLASWERFKGGQRLEFLCGARALTRARLHRETVAGAVRLLSVLPTELPPAIERLQSELKEQRRALSTAQLELAAYEAVALADAAEPWLFGRVVLRVVDGDAVRLKALASAIAGRPGLFAVLVSSATPSLVVAARSTGLDRSCHELIAALASRFGGRGGGRPDFAQCGGLQAPADEILACARERLAEPDAPRPGVR